MRVLQAMPRMLPRCWGGSFSLASCSINEPGQAERIECDAEDVAGGVAHFLLPAGDAEDAALVRLRMLPRCCGGSF